MRESDRIEYCKLGKRIEILRYEIGQLSKTREDLQKNIEKIQKKQRLIKDLFDEMLEIEDKYLREI